MHLFDGKLLQKVVRNMRGYFVDIRTPVCVQVCNGTYRFISLASLGVMPVCIASQVIRTSVLLPQLLLLHWRLCKQQTYLSALSLIIQPAEALPILCCKCTITVQCCSFLRIKRKETFIAFPLLISVISR